MGEKTQLCDLPDLCVNLVACLLLRECGGSTSAAASCAARLMLVGEKDREGPCRVIASHLFDAVDRGCVAAEAARRSALRDAKSAAAEYLANPPPPPAEVDVAMMSCAGLRAACKEAGCPSSGSKAEMAASLRAACEVERADRDAAMQKVDAIPLVECWCPVRPRVRRIIRAWRTGAKITATAARAIVGGSVVDGLPCELLRNPRFRSAAPMRLYSLAAVLEAAQALGKEKKEKKKKKKKGVEETDEPTTGAEIIARAIAQAGAERRALSDLDAEERRRSKRDARLESILHDVGVDRADLALSDVSAFLAGRKIGPEMATCAAHAKGVRDRRSTLVSELHALGCELRGDSRLCEAYIERGEGFPLAIAVIMREMKFYYEETSFPAIAQAIMDSKVALARSCGERLDQEEYGYLRLEANEEARAEALRLWVKRFPSRSAAMACPALPASLGGPARP